MKNTHEALVNAARLARDQARAKYSNFKVGSALLCGDGRIFTGCNIESSSYGLTICSERVALFKALSEGADNFVRIVVVADTDQLTAPCGACRQLMWDFCGDLEVVLTNLSGKSKTLCLTQLFPEPFGDHLFSLPGKNNSRDVESQATSQSFSVVDIDPKTLLMLSIQRALLGEVTPNLLSVTCGLQNNKITIRAYFDGPVSSADRERIESVGGEVIADFAEDFTIEEICSSIQDEEPEMLDFWAFMRIS